MKRKKNSGIILCLVLLCLLTISSGKAQQELNWIEKARNAEESKNYALAALLYERVYFQSSDSLLKIESLIKRAANFKYAGDFENVEKTLGRIELKGLNDSVKTHLLYERSFANYNLQQYKKADELLWKIYSNPYEDSTTIFSLFLHGLVLNELSEYTFAKQKFSEFFNKINLDVGEKAEVDSILSSTYSKRGLPKIRSLKKARRLSMIIPGSGIFYAGYPGRAAVNISLQAISVLYIAGNIISGTYLTAATAGIHLFLMFYTGGVNQLNYLIEERNTEKITRFNSEIKKSLISKIKI